MSFPKCSIQRIKIENIRKMYVVSDRNVQINIKN